MLCPLRPPTPVASATGIPSLARSDHPVKWPKENWRHGPSRRGRCRTARRESSSTPAIPSAPPRPKGSSHTTPCSQRLADRRIPMLRVSRLVQIIPGRNGQDHCAPVLDSLLGIGSPCGLPRREDMDCRARLAWPIGDGKHLNTSAARWQSRWRSRAAPRPTIAAHHTRTPWGKAPPYRACYLVFHSSSQCFPW